MKNDDIDTLYIEAEAIKHPKKSHTRKAPNGKRIKVRSTVEVAKADYKRTKAQHKAQIKALRNNIRSHKLLIKQAKNAYKLIKLENK